MSEVSVGIRIARALADTDDALVDAPASMEPCPECGQQRFSPKRDDSPYRFCLACGYYEETE